MTRRVQHTRAARADALAQLIAKRGGRLRLTRSLLYALDAAGIARGQVDQAVDQLVEDGRAVVRAEDGQVVVALNGRRP